MGIVGSAIGGALGIGASIFGGISASKAMKKAKGMVEQEKRDNQDWFDRRYNEDATQRADAQRVLTATNDSIRERNRQAAGAQAVMGGTDEALASAKAANNQALADATSQIAVSAEARKGQLEQQYRQNESELNDKLRSFEVGKANAVAQAVQGVADAGASMGEFF
ncbi:MAG: hypothetical protein K2I56_07750 [Muribaculaceae bacterium]|nr:hypothetical protein [Muribaculaceae bacterium]